MSDNQEKKSLININLLPEKAIDSLVTPGAGSIGTAFKDVIEGLSHLTLGKLRMYNLVKEKELNDFADKLNNKINDIPEINRDQSKMGITFKALEDSKYQLNEEIMREAFSNLIANSLNSEKNSEISPKYSDILCNMSSREADLFSKIYHNNRGIVPVITVDIKTNNSGRRRVFDYTLVMNDKSLIISEQVSLSLLQASNIIRIREDSNWTAPQFIELYDHAEKQFVEGNFQHHAAEDETVEMTKHALDLTSLGKELAKILFS